MVRFLPFDCTDEEGVNIVLQHIDFSIQYGEDLELKEPKVKTLQCKINAVLSDELVSSHLFPPFPFLQEADEEPTNLNYDEIFQHKTES